MARSRKLVFPLAGLAIILLLGAGAWWYTTHGPGVTVPELGEVVTFAEDVGPIILNHCASCHRSSGAAPFELITYADVADRADEIADVTGRRVMPPWLPGSDLDIYKYQRSLSDGQIDTIRKWVAGGCVEGGVANLPENEEWPEGWQLGTPDQVVKMPRPYHLPPGGEDIVRNFVIPFSAKKRLFVNAIEFRPGNPRVVRHAFAWFESTGATRGFDARDMEPGSEGMPRGVDAVHPDSHLLVWTPGMKAERNEERAPWRLESRLDLILQLHMVPSDDPEIIEAELGLYYADNIDIEETKPLLLRFGPRILDIPAGESTHVIEDSFRLPVKTRVLEIYPHAHHFCRRISVTAVLPDEHNKPLIEIDDWNADLREPYRYLRPIVLPEGSEIKMQFVFDNSANNPRNPNDPPIQVGFGPRFSNTIGDLWVQVLTENNEDRYRLKKNYADKAGPIHRAGYEHKLEMNPDDELARFNLGWLQLQYREWAKARKSLEEVIRVAPDFAPARSSLGLIYMGNGNLKKAVKYFDEALESDPDCYEAHINLGMIALQNGRPGDAIKRFKLAVLSYPYNADCHTYLGYAYLELGFFSDAVKRFQKAQRLDPEDRKPVIAMEKVVKFFQEEKLE